VIKKLFTVQLLKAKKLFPEIGL